MTSIPPSRTHGMTLRPSTMPRHISRSRPCGWSNAWLESATAKVMDFKHQRPLRLCPWSSYSVESRSSKAWSQVTRPRLLITVAPTLSLANMAAGFSKVFAMDVVSEGTDAVSVPSACPLIKAPIMLMLQERLMRSTTPLLFLPSYASGPRWCGSTRRTTPTSCCRQDF